MRCPKRANLKATRVCKTYPTKIPQLVCHMIIEAIGYD